MSGVDGSVNDDDCRLAGFERNRYFNGKLMTARDMLAEQGYHVDRTNTLAQTVLGEGIVRGLDVTNLTATETEFTAEVAAGVALDSCGRLLVVPEASGTIPVTNADAEGEETTPPSTNLVYLYLHYDDCYKQTVPALGSENGCADDCEYNRVLEQFELHYREVQPGTDPANLPKDGKPVPDVSFPTSTEVEDDEFAALHRMARSYYEVGDGDKAAEGGASENGNPRPHGELSAFPDDDERTVFLGAFGTGDGGETWSERRGVDRPERPYVYTNDFLHAGLARHVTDFENPHEVLLSVLAADGAAGIDDPIVRTADGPADPAAFSPGDVQLRSPTDSVEIAGVPGAADTGDGVTFDLPADYRDILDTEFDDHIADTSNPHQVTAGQIGAILRVNGQDLGAVVELQGDGVTFDVNTSDNIVTIEAQVPEIPEPEEPNPVETRFGRHVIERALYAKCAAFRRVGQFDVSYPEGFDGTRHDEAVKELRAIVNQAIMADDGDGESYRDDEGNIEAGAVAELFKEIAKLEDDIRQALEAVEQDVGGLERYEKTLDRLFKVVLGGLSDEEKAVEAAMAQELVIEAAACLEVRRG